MRIPLPLVVVPSVVLLAVVAIHAQIANPIADPIVKRGLSVQVKEVVRLPDTRGLRPADQDVLVQLEGVLDARHETHMRRIKGPVSVRQATPGLLISCISENRCAGDADFL